MIRYADVKPLSMCARMHKFPFDGVRVRVQRDYGRERDEERGHTRVRECVRARTYDECTCVRYELRRVRILRQRAHPKYIYVLTCVLLTVASSSPCRNAAR